MLHDYPFLSMDGQGSLGGKKIYRPLGLISSVGNPTQGKGNRASKSNVSYARIIQCPSPNASCFLTMYLLVAVDRLVMKQGIISPSSSKYQTQQVSYEWKRKFDIKVPYEGNRQRYYVAATKQTLLCRALCFQEPSKNHSNIIASHNPVHVLIQIETIWERSWRAPSLKPQTITYHDL